VQKFDVVTGEQAKGAAGPPSYTNVFAEALAEADATTRDLRDHRGDAERHRARQVRQAIPTAASTSASPSSTR
jgi:hypothetical protein